VPAPALFSITKVWPICPADYRQTVSSRDVVALPAVNGNDDA